MNFLDVLNPQWANAEHTAINVMVVEETLGELPFTAMPNDSTEYGPEIFMRAAAGEYGDVAAYEPPSDAALLPAARSQQKRLMQDAGLAAAPLQDAVDLGVATDEQVEQLTAWKFYRIELSEVPQQAGWPRAIEWPVTPDQQTP
ncbi:tail fiber assembly protein [Pseudomonas sp. Irchel s3b6]|uniref:tail fiber assembly protein n=1 Tax=Pseudomonas sp. Irchel s3b6 TaxID=2009078 RepID=UPI000BA4840D|nr:tail fiber assembly protein [Pseudomonas sp. Irchel s3b6]